MDCTEWPKTAFQKREAEACAMKVVATYTCLHLRLCHLSSLSLSLSRSWNGTKRRGVWVGDGETGGTVDSGRHRGDD